MMNETKLEILRILEENGRLSIDTIAKLVQRDKEEVAKIIQSLEDEKMILGYRAVVDWEKDQENTGVTAMIDVKVTPKRGVGFEQVAKRIYRFKEVDALYLMSGAYDLSVVVHGETMTEVANFVSEKLSTLDDVVSTTTHFRLKTYKHDGVIFHDEDNEDKRMVVSP